MLENGNNTHYCTADDNDKDDAASHLLNYYFRENIYANVVEAMTNKYYC